eukprot:scaffold462_cov195-Pinguiococcus_pyrenoidosus.AAC.7
MSSTFSSGIQKIALERLKNGAFCEKAKMQNIGNLISTSLLYIRSCHSKKAVGAGSSCRVESCRIE